jgi:hypothetical protein
MDINYLQFAETPLEKKYMEALIEYGSQSKAANALGVTKNTINKASQRVKRRATKRGYSPDHDMQHTAPEGFHVKGVSTYYNEEGKPTGQWVKTNKDKEETLEKLKESVEAIIEPCKGLAEPIEAPKNTTSELMACYIIADAHLGMYSWAAEAGEDYDLVIAERTIHEGMTELAESAPPTKTCLIANLADYFHADTNENKTLRSGNILDVDSRWAKVLQVGVRAYRNVINLALAKHEKVIVKSGIGNHDDHSVFCLAMMMQAYFENEPRVEVHLPVNPYAYYVFEKNLIGIHHGNIKTDRLPGIMATDVSAEWGQTSFRVFLGGHLHHRQVKEYPGCTVELFRSIAANDAYGHGAGFRSGRSMEMIIFEKDGGEHGRRVVNIR